MIFYNWKVQVNNSSVLSIYTSQELNQLMILLKVEFEFQEFYDV
jgi:hypothetical protein